MSRRWVPILVLLTSCAATPGWAQPVSTTEASEKGPIVRPHRERPAALYAVEGGSSSKSAPDVSPGASGRSAPAFWASLPEPGRDAEGNPCVRTTRYPYPTAGAAAIAEDVARVVWPLAVRSYPLCPGVVIPDPTPATEAASYWRVAGEDLLPKPAPRIAPGYMLAGKLAYLEANTQPSVHFEHPTPLGLLTIDANSKLFVDWGAGGRLDGPHTGPGGPWPGGNITHYWTDARAYDIRVEQRWSATWHLAGQGGTLVGLTTEGVIPDFEVRQLQAVRNR